MLLDIGMPVADGYLVVRRLRALRGQFVFGANCDGTSIQQRRGCCSVFRGALVGPTRGCRCTSAACAGAGGRRTTCGCGAGIFAGRSRQEKRAPATEIDHVNGPAAPHSRSSTKLATGSARSSLAWAWRLFSKNFASWPGGSCRRWPSTGAATGPSATWIPRLRSFTARSCIPRAFNWMGLLLPQLPHV